MSWVKERCIIKINLTCFILIVIINHLVTVVVHIMLPLYNVTTEDNLLS